MRDRRPRGLLLLAALLVTVATPAVAQDLKSAEAFLRSLYSGYMSGQKTPSPTGRVANDLFAPPLLALIRADQALAAGEVGILDRDPICACQDYDTLEQLKIGLKPGGPARANGTVSFKNSGTATIVRFSLMEVNGNWRIGDISEPGITSMRRFLADGIASRARDLAK